MALCCHKSAGNQYFRLYYFTCQAVPHNTYDSSQRIVASWNSSSFWCKKQNWNYVKYKKCIFMSLKRVWKWAIRYGGFLLPPWIISGVTYHFKETHLAHSLWYSECSWVNNIRGVCCRIVDQTVSCKTVLFTGKKKLFLGLCVSALEHL